ncbi:MAG TPA: TolC family protein [Gemmataceae bacterium]|nr:TolC family protein [Gemmataceae bacterium]
MSLVRRRWWPTLVLLGGLAGVAAVHAQEPAPAPAPLACPVAAPTDRPLPINLPTALQLAGVRPIDISIASERIRTASAQLDRANVLWLPTVYVGGDYFRHDGQIQDVAGNVLGTSKSSLMFGAGPSAVFAISDALFQPLAARQELRAREAALQTARNDSLLAAAEAYFNVQQARGELAGAIDAARRAEEVAHKAEELTKSLVPLAEAARTRAEAARRRQAVLAAREHWRTASAELTRVLRLDAAAVVEPLEPPHLQVALIAPDRSVDELIGLALTSRPELAAQQALVRATLERLRAERLRPLIPSVLLRGASTSVTGTLAGGYFGGGINDKMSNFGGRLDIDVQVLWEFQNLGFGNRARVEERKAENRVSVLELFRLQDRVAAEVAQAHAQLESAAARLAEAEAGLRDAVDSANKNLEGMGLTKSTGKGPDALTLLVIRPLEAVASVQALAQAYADYYGAIGDYNRAQFRLYRALGAPAQAAACELEKAAPQ